jgi:flagellar hook-associated protein 3 FlgL
MSFNYISTYNLFSPLRFSITRNQSALSRATTEATTGRFADVGLELGHATGLDLGMRAEFDFADQIVDTNGLASGRLEVIQDRITKLGTTAQDFLKSLITVRNTGVVGAQSILPTAAAGLQDLIGSLNVSYNGSFVFAGLNTQTAPLTNYAPGSTSKIAADAAFATFFGFSQASPAVSGITAAQMQTFLNTTFDAEFVSNLPPPPALPGPWNTKWS